MTELLQACWVKPPRWLAKGLVRRPQPLGQNTHHLEGKVGGLADQKQELLFGYRHQFDIGCGHGGGAPRLAVDQGHLAENAVLAKLGNRPVADLNPNLSALDHEQLFGLVAFPENDATSLERSSH